MKKIVFTVTNDLTYDQRMKRICGSLSNAGYEVVLVGYSLKTSRPLEKKTYKQKRLPCWFKKGKLFYVEYNIRLFFFHLFTRADCICAIDLDTILPCYIISRIKNIKRVYDAHEYFSQLEEITSRPMIYRFWHWLERTMLPRFKYGYTVGHAIAQVFKEKYGVDYEVIRNMPLLRQIAREIDPEKFILYQGAVNKGRGLDEMAIAMKQIDLPMIVCGDGNFMKELKETINKNHLSEKIILKGMLLPEQLKEITAKAYIAINPFRKEGLNQYLSLSNKFFDYIHGGVPQVTMNYPEYKTINDHYEVAVLINNPVANEIAVAIKKIVSDKELYCRLEENCARAKKMLNWEKEEKKLLNFYEELFNE